MVPRPSAPHRTYASAHAPDEPTQPASCPEDTDACLCRIEYHLGTRQPVLRVTPSFGSRTGGSASSPRLGVKTLGSQDLPTLGPGSMCSAGSGTALEVVPLLPWSLGAPLPECPHMPARPVQDRPPTPGHKARRRRWCVCRLVVPGVCRGSKNPPGVSPLS